MRKQLYRKRYRETAKDRTVMSFFTVILKSTEYTVPSGFAELFQELIIVDIRRLKTLLLKEHMIKLGQDYAGHSYNGELVVVAFLYGHSWF